MNNHGLHIVAFDVPYPADYGGVIEIFNKIKALHNAGVKIHLHAYQYGRVEAAELLQYCEKVYYYKRSGFNTLLSIRPYIVASRDSWQLLANLQLNQWPILFEGLHTCYFLNHKKLSNRKKIVRLHNVEHNYYSQLASREANLFKKIYYVVESYKLKWFEAILVNATHLLPISTTDEIYFRGNYKESTTTLIDPFLENSEVNAQIGMGQYILYHGNLSVNENEQAATYLIKNLFSKIDFPVIIAGKNPSQSLQDKVKQYSGHIQLVANPNRETMQKLVTDAQLHVLFTAQPTGIKLKLFNSLLNGRHCLANSLMLTGTDAGTVCEIADDAETMLAKVQQLVLLPFTEEQVQDRKMFFNAHCNNNSSLEKLLKILF